jgi:hypothetical protein
MTQRPSRPASCASLTNIATRRLRFIRVSARHRRAVTLCVKTLADKARFCAFVSSDLKKQGVKAHEIGLSDET